MSMFQDGCEYYCTHYWWDSEDNDFELMATWQYEGNYPDMPDYWHLIEIELDYCDGVLPNHIVDLVKDGCRNGGSIWCDIERQGPDIEHMYKVDYS